MPVAMTEAAPAKINLCLHVTGQRADGYHLLDSLVVFADIADRISVSAAPALSLRVTGPQAAGLAAELAAGADNLVLRAAQSLAAARGPVPGAAITLDKQLPLASGIGGGSADAAATLRALACLWRVALPDATAVLALGADVPVCLAGRPARMRGIGAELSAVPPLPPAWLVLVNPGVAVATPAVFKALAKKTNPGLPEVPHLADAPALAAWLGQQRNDLEPAAEALAPVIAEVRRALAAQPGCLLARMSGSGATCFGLFADPATAHAAKAALASAERQWWVAAGRMLG